MAVKGRDQPIRVYTPLAVAAAASAGDRALAEAHASALAKLRGGNRTGARAAFQHLAGEGGRDPLAALYAGRCVEPAWDGVFHLDAK